MPNIRLAIKDFGENGYLKAGRHTELVSLLRLRRLADLAEAIFDERLIF